MQIESALKNIVGADRVSTSEVVCLSYSFNIGYTRHVLRKPDIVVMVGSPKEVSEVLKVANQYKVPVTPKGAAGGAGTGGPLNGGILLDLTLMDKIVLVDPDNMKAVAEAGCSFFRLSQELFKNNLLLPVAAYGPGPNVAASAITPPNGIGAARYGVNTNLVEGLEVVLASGEIIKVGSMAYADSEFGPYYRYITGPDLVGLFTKSNGAFGIVTKVAYRCIHKPKYWAFHSYYWPEDKIADITKVMCEATAIEMFEVHLFDKWWAGTMVPDLPGDCDFILALAVNSESEQELSGKEEVLKNLCRIHGGAPLPNVAETIYTEWPTYLWSLGLIKNTDPLVERPRGQLCLLDEPIYPLSKVPEVHSKIMELFAKHGLRSAERGPGYDGFVMNAQVICSPIVFFLDDRDPDQVDRFHKCQREFREWFGKKGGTFQYRLPPEAPDFVWTNQLDTLTISRKIKAVLDPNDILSPGTFGFLPKEDMET